MNWVMSFLHLPRVWQTHPHMLELNCNSSPHHMTLIKDHWTAWKRCEDYFHSSNSLIQISAKFFPLYIYISPSSGLFFISPDEDLLFEVETSWVKPSLQVSMLTIRVKLTLQTLPNTNPSRQDEPFQSKINVYKRDILYLSHVHFNLNDTCIKLIFDDKQKLVIELVYFLVTLVEFKMMEIQNTFSIIWFFC